MLWLILGLLCYLWASPDSYILLLLIVQSLIPTVLICIASIGFGLRLFPNSRWDLVLLIGFGSIGTLLYPISLLFGPQMGIVLLGVGAFFAWKNRWYWRGPVLPSTYWTLIAILSSALMWNAQSTIIDTDSLYYQLSLPKQLWEHNRLLGGELLPNASRPLLIHLPLALVYGMGGNSAVILCSSMIALSIWVSIVEFVEFKWQHAGWMVWALVLGSYSVLEQLTVVNTNMLVMGWVWLAYRELYQQPKRIIPFGQVGLLLGFAVSGKYTAIAVSLLVGLLAFKPVQWKFREAIIAMMVILVWPLRNCLEGLHPLFPYAGWDIPIPFVYVEKYGMGRGLTDFMLAPWNLLVHAEVDSFRFLGQLSPVFFMVMVGWGRLILNKEWRVVCVTLGAFGFWFIGPHWIRHLFPMLGIVSAVGILSVVQNQKLSSVLLWVLLFFVGGLSSNTGAFVDKCIRRSEIQQEIPGLKATEWLNQYATEGEVALLFLWTGALLEQPYVLSSVEDHTPIRHWLLKYQDEALHTLYREGVRYIAVGPHSFHATAYPFLEKRTLEQLWWEPVALLERLLLRDAQWVTRIEGVDIYLLRNPLE